MKVLVIGGAGYIGSHAVRRFAERGHEVWTYDNLSCGHRDAVADNRLVAADVLNPNELVGVMRALAIDAVVHFAALTSVSESVAEPARFYNNNVIGTLNVLEAMRRCDVSRLVFSSSAAVYGRPRRTPIQEDDPLEPISPYGRSKLMVEQALADYAAAYGFGYAALRYFNAAGASPAGDIGEDHHPETHLIPIVLQAALGRRPHVEVCGDDYATADGTCVRDYIHVDDLAEAHLLCLEKLAPGDRRIYNLGIGRGHSVNEVISACREVTGRPIPVKRAPRRAGDPPKLLAGPNRALRELDWRPRFTDLREIVETAWRWHRSHPTGYANAGT